MKSIIIPVITAFLWISLVAADAQDNSTGGSVVEEVKTETGSGTSDNITPVETVKEEKTVSTESDTSLTVKPQEKKSSNKNN